MNDAGAILDDICDLVAASILGILTIKASASACYTPNNFTCSISKIYYGRLYGRDWSSVLYTSDLYMDIGK